MGVGHDHEVLIKIFLLNIIILSVESSKSHNDSCIVIVDDYCYVATVGIKIMTAKHCYHC